MARYISEILIHEKPDTERVGIEVELEGVSLEMCGKDFDEHPMTYWSLYEDGSLKNKGVEFVTTSPVTGPITVQQVAPALKELQAFISKRPYVATVRTGVHVHLDVNDMTEKELLNLLDLYVIFEKSLYRLGGLHRIANNNCLRIGDTNWFSCFHNDYRKFGFSTNAICRLNKYVGLNLSSITHARRGSLEFRMHEGTTDMDRVHSWVRLLQGLKAIAQSDFDGETFISTIEKGDRYGNAVHFVKEKLPLLFTSYKYHPMLAADVISGVGDLQCIYNKTYILQSGRVMQEDLLTRFR